jgi:hypothetical protein
MYCGQMRIIAFITRSTYFRKILNHLGQEFEPPGISAPCGPLLWQDYGAQMGKEPQVEPTLAIDWDGAAQPVPDYDVDQRIDW